MTARNNPLSAVTSKVSATEAKLIIALRKDLLVASKLIENDRKQKEKLVDIARTLRNQCLKLQKEKADLEKIYDGPKDEQNQLIEEIKISRVVLKVNSTV